MKNMEYPLTGAVAGLADQPMQTLIGSEGGGGVLEERRGSSPSSTATGIMTGVGKGLVGVLTKPIGGAAEFVSQTGQGEARFVVGCGKCITSQSYSMKSEYLARLVGITHNDSNRGGGGGGMLYSYSILARCNRKTCASILFSQVYNLQKANVCTFYGFGDKKHESY